MAHIATHPPFHFKHGAHSNTSSVSFQTWRT